LAGEMSPHFTLTKRKNEELKFTPITKNCDQALQADLILMQQLNIKHREYPPLEHALQYTGQN
jgi:hypothetical protein